MRSSTVLLIYIVGSLLNYITLKNNRFTIGYYSAHSEVLVEEPLATVTVSFKY